MYTVLRPYSPLGRDAGIEMVDVGRAGFGVCRESLVVDAILRAHKSIHLQGLMTCEKLDLAKENRSAK